MAKTEAQTASAVPARATQGAEARKDWSWVEASVWTQRMVSALENGVKGGRWYSRTALGPQEEPEPPQGQDQGEDATSRRAEPRADHRGPQPDPERLVRLLPARPSLHLPNARRVHSPAASIDPAQAEDEAVLLRNEPGDPSTLAQLILRGSRVACTSHGLA